MVLRTELDPNFLRGVDARIDFSSEPLLRTCQRLHYFSERYVSNYEQVDVAGGAKLAAGRRPEDQSHYHALAERRERLAQQVGKACGLGK